MRNGNGNVGLLYMETACLDCGLLDMEPDNNTIMICAFYILVIGKKEDHFVFFMQNCPILVIQSIVTYRVCVFFTFS